MFIRQVVPRLRMEALLNVVANGHQFSTGNNWETADDNETHMPRRGKTKVIAAKSCVTT